MNQDILNYSTVDPLLSMSYHIDFYDFLSFQEALKSLNMLIDNLNLKINSGEENEEDGQNIASLVNSIDKLAERILSFLHASDTISHEEKIKLIRILNSNTLVSTKMLGKMKNFQHLRFMLMTTTDDHHENIPLTPLQSSPLEVFEVLLNTPDELLLTRGVHLYKTNFVTEHSHDASRLHHAHVFFNAMQQHGLSDFKHEFIVEWIFEKSIINALINEELIYIFISILKEIVQKFGHNPAFMHGMLRALQKDYIVIGKFILQKNENFETEILEKSTSLIEPMFPHFVELAKEDLTYLSKQIIDFTFALPVPKEEFRIIKWNQWRWIRMIAAHTWDASLREPPSWVISAGSAYCAIIFDCAPPVWLQDYAYLLIERVYAETLVEGFVPQPQHYDYVEFLIRTLKKKSPYFASHHDSYLALNLLSRLTHRESNKETFINYIPSQLLESNPMSQALGILLNMTRKSISA